MRNVKQRLPRSKLLLRPITVEVSSSSERSEDLIIQSGIQKNIPRSASERKLLEDLRIGLAMTSIKKNDLISIMKAMITSSEICTLITEALRDHT